MAKCGYRVVRWLLVIFALGLAPAWGASRVITLAPNLTELAFAAGITPIGVSSYSDYPDAATRIERVANWQGINVERIIALKPDLVLAWRGGNPARQVDQLQRLGITVLWTQPESLDVVGQSIARLAPFSPTPALARQQADAFATTLETLRQRYAHSVRRQVFLQFGLRPMFTAAGNTLQNQVLALCGGDNIFARSPVPWPQVSREQVLARHPQVIVTGGDDRQKAAIQTFWSPQLKVPVIVVNDDWFSRPGPRILLAAQALCQQLQPGIPVR